MMKIDYKYPIMCGALLIAIAFTMISFGDETYGGVYLLMLSIGGFLVFCGVLLSRLQKEEYEKDERALLNYGRAAGIAFAYVITFGAICTMTPLGDILISYFDWNLGLGYFLIEQ